MPNDQNPRPPKVRRETLLSSLVTVIVVAGTLSGFVLGRRVGQDTYVNKVRSLLATEHNTATLYDVLGEQRDDPSTKEALAKLYNVPMADHEGLVACLRKVAWWPPYRPAPFVGLMAKPLLGPDLHINALGFRDDRQTYITKPRATVRIFITGGSAAWGSGASAQAKTISYVLEQILNKEMTAKTGYRYEVVNTAFPGWSTTHERLLIEQRLLQMHPDIVLMFSGNNDVHWTRNGRDIRWFYGPLDQNYMLLLNELYKSSGHSEWSFALPASSHPIASADLALITARNVEDAAVAVSRANARLIFVLQPNVVSVTKHLSKRERQLPEMQNKAYWDDSYRALRQELGRIKVTNFKFLDFSQLFGEFDENTELFVDSYHFADEGYGHIARTLAGQIDWMSVRPDVASAGDDQEPLKIVRLEPTERNTRKLFHHQTPAVRIVPNRLNPNLVILADDTILATVVEHDAVVAESPALEGKREHSISIMDTMTGETSTPVVYPSRR